MRRRSPRVPLEDRHPRNRVPATTPRLFALRFEPANQNCACPKLPSQIAHPNPLFSLEKWGNDVWTSDPYGRNFAGMPPAKSGDYAFVQHMIKSMVPKTGRMAVVLPHGALFRMGKEGGIRQKLLAMDLLEALIGLGSTLFTARASPPASLSSGNRKRRSGETKC